MPLTSIEASHAAKHPVTHRTMPHQQIMDERRPMGMKTIDIHTQGMKEAKLAESTTTNMNDRGEVGNFSQASNFSD